MLQMRRCYSTHTHMYYIKSRKLCLTKPRWLPDVMTDIGIEERVLITGQYLFTLGGYIIQRNFNIV